MNFRFFQILFNPKSNFADVALFKTNMTFEAIYITLKQEYQKIARTLEKGNQYQKIVDNFDKLRDKHIKFLKQYQIDVRAVMDEYRIDEDEKEDRASYTYRESLSVRMTDLANDNIRLLIAGLPSVTLDEERMDETLDEYRMRSTVRFNRVMNILNEKLTGLGNDPQEYFDVLRGLVERRPEFKVLLDRLKADEKTISKNTLLLQNSFVQTFGHNKNVPLVVTYDLEGGISFRSATENAVERLIREEWRNNLRELVGKDSFSEFNSRGSIIINTQKLIGAITNSEKVPDVGRERLNAQLDILEKLGIVITRDRESIYNSEVVNNYVSYLKDELKELGKKELLANDLFNADVIANQKEVRALLNYSLNFFENDTDLMYFNQEGNREFPITLNSHTTSTINALNRIKKDATGELVVPDSIRDLMPYDGTEGSLFTIGSSWIDNIKAGNKLHAIMYSGVTDPTKNGTDIHKSTFGDYKASLFNGLLKGIVPHLRSADRKTEVGFQIVDSNGIPIELDYSITEAHFHSVLDRYLRTELITSFALLIDPENYGGNLKYYRDNAKELRVFEFLGANLEQYFKDNFVDNNKDVPSLAIALADKFIRDNRKSISSSYSDYIGKLINLTEESLKEDSVIRTDGDNYFLLGIDPSILSNFGIKAKSNGVITRAQMRRIIAFANYQNFIGANEQLRLILGDLAFYKNKIEFHKRVTGSTSTKYTQADSKQVQEDLDRLYLRVDGKSRTSSATIMVMNDVISQNKELGIKFKAYNSIEGTNGQSWQTMDAHRDMMLRHGMWGVDYEKTYQYVMQKFALKMLELQKFRKLPFTFSTDMFTNPNGVFYEHTKGEMPIEPVFKGKRLKLEELAAIPIQKPQGFGFIGDIKGINAIQYWKTAVGPIDPNELDGPVLDVVLSMMANEIDILTFDSSMKATKVGNQSFTPDKDGNIDLGTYQTQELRYSDFGIQLDIHDETEGDVTQSTQRTALEFLNVFERGVAKNKELEALSNEYDNLTNEIVSLRRENLLHNTLALTLNTETGQYELLADKVEDFEEKMINAVQHRFLPESILDSISLALKSEDRVFDGSKYKFKLEQILNSMVRNNVISRKIPGEMNIQESSWLYEHPLDYENNRNLKFYREENGEIKAMEVMIALPKNLIPFVEKLGGLNKLNEAISTNDKKLLGTNFWKLLHIPMNRIPGQNLSSLDVAIVKRFLPPYHGTKVVLPPEITVKSDADFDVDKMTSYYKHFRVENGEIKYFDNKKSQEFKENRLTEIAEKALLNPDRFDELITPLDTKKIRDLAMEARDRSTKSIIEEATLKATTSDVLSLWYNNQKAYEFWKSKKGTSGAAVQTTQHAFSQKHPVRMNFVAPLFFEGQEQTLLDIGKPGVFYNTGFTKDNSDYKISDSLAEFISAFIDAVKDPFVFELATASNYSIIAMLNRYGKKSGTGLDTIAYFMSQDIIKEYNRVVRENNSKFLTYNTYKTSETLSVGVKDFISPLNYAQKYEEAVFRIKEKLNPTDINVPLNFENTVAYTLQNYILEEDPYTKQQLLDEVYNRIRKYKYEYFSKEDLKDNTKDDFHAQVQILDNYLMYQVLSNPLFSLSRLLRAGAKSGLEAHMGAINSSISQTVDYLIRTNVFNIDDLNKAINGDQETEKSSQIAEFYRTKANITSYLGWSSMIYKDPTITAFFENEIYGRFGDPSLRQKQTTIDKAYRDAESDFLVFVMAWGLNQDNENKLQDVYRYLMTGTNSVARQLVRKRKEIPGNVGLQTLYANIAQRDNRSKTFKEIDNITLYNRNLDPNEIDANSLDLEELGTNSTPENMNFIRSLVIESVFQSGYANSPTSFMDIVPDNILHGISSEYVNRFLRLDPVAKSNLLNVFLEQFYRNNADNKNIVPMGKFPLKGTSYHDKKDFFKGRDYIAMRQYTGKNKSRVVLLQRRGSSRVFGRIPKLGDGMRFKEYYPMLIDAESILITNNYRSLPNEYTEPEERNYEETHYQDSIPQSYEEEEPDFPESPEETNPTITKAFSPDSIRMGVTYLPDGVENEYVKTIRKRSGLSQEDLERQGDIVATTLQNVLKLIQKNSSNSARAELARILEKAIPERASLQFERKYFEQRRDDRGNRVIGDYNPPEDSRDIPNYGNSLIRILDSLSKDSIEVAILHEALHYISYRELVINPDFYKKIDRMSFHVKDFLISYHRHDLVDRMKTMLSDPHEFISYGLTSSFVQEVLSKVPSENQEEIEGRKPSVLSDFWNTIRDLILEFFNLLYKHSDPQYNTQLQNITTALQELVLAVDDLIVSEPLKPKPIIREFSEADIKSNIKAMNAFELGKETPQTEEGNRVASTPTGTSQTIVNNTEVNLNVSTEKGAIGVNKQQLIALLGSSMYNKPIGLVAIKELLQNSFDAVKAAQNTQGLGTGTIDIEIDSDDRTITVRDDGVGMTPEIVKQAFLNIGGTNKEGLSTAERSGGLGLAKVQFLLGSEFIRVKTVRNGIKTEIEASNTQLYNDDFEIKTSSTSEENGTTVSIKIPKSYVTLEGVTKNIGFPTDVYYNIPLLLRNNEILNKPLIGDVNVVLTLTKRGQTNTDIVPIGKNITNLPPLFTRATFNWGEADVYISENKVENPKHYILSAGLYQFQKYFSIRSFETVPYDIVINIKPSVPSNSEQYPFNNQRENFKGTVEDDIDSLSAYIAKFAMGEAEKEARDTFKNLVPLPILDPNAILTEQEKATLLNSVYNSLNRKTEQSSIQEVGRKIFDIIIKNKQVEDKDTSEILISKKNEKDYSSSFKAEKEIENNYNIDVESFNPAYPQYHNNTSVDYSTIPGALEFFTDFGNVVLQMVRYAGDELGYQYEKLTSKKEKFFAGVSIDKTYGGVHIRKIMNAIFVNPLSFEPKNIEEAIGIALHVTIHEINHTTASGEDEIFTTHLGRLYGNIYGSGKYNLFENLFRSIYNKHFETFKILKNEFDKSTTRNLSKSIKEDQLKIGSTRSLQGHGKTLQGRQASEERPIGDTENIKGDRIGDVIASKLAENNRVISTKPLNLTDNFAKLYPEYEHFNSVEREAFEDAVRKGEIQLACGL
jgi:transcriptional regulator with XRE-family HTH domain